MGFCGPEPDAAVIPTVKDNEPGKVDMVILDDSGNGFRDDSSAWPEAISDAGKPMVILKMSRPLLMGDLWQHLMKRHADNLIVVLSVNDLRDCGMNISRRLSWERTAQDFIGQMANTPIGHELLKLNHLIVRLGIEGAIYYNNEFSKATLYYDHRSCEDDHRESGIGSMQGLTCAFVAAMSSRFLDESPDILTPLPEEEEREAQEGEEKAEEYVVRRDRRGKD